MKRITRTGLMNAKYLIIGVAISLFVHMYIIKPALAQQITLSISPPIVETLIKPGKSILLGYTVENLGDPTTLEFKIRSFSPRGDFGEMKIDDELISPIRFSLDNSDIQLEKPFLIKQRESKQALVRIRVPEGTPEGDYYFVILATSYPVPAIGGTTSSLSKATIGSTLLMTVTQSGRVETKARIALFDIVPDNIITLFGKKYKIVESATKVPINLVIQNLGKNLIKPNGEITLRNPLGEKTVIPITPQNILAESQRQMNISPLSGYFIGTYTVSARVTFGENSPQLFSNVTFVGFPTRLFISFLFLIALSVFIIFIMKSKKK